MGHAQDLDGRFEDSSHIFSGILGPLQSAQRSRPCESFDIQGVKPLLDFCGLLLREVPVPVLSIGTPVVLSSPVSRLHLLEHDRPAKRFRITGKRNIGKRSTETCGDLSTPKRLKKVGATGIWAFEGGGWPAT